MRALLALSLVGLLMVGCKSTPEEKMAEPEAPPAEEMATEAEEAVDEEAPAAEEEALSQEEKTAKAEEEIAAMEEHLGSGSMRRGAPRRSAGGGWSAADACRDRCRDMKYQSDTAPVGAANRFEECMRNCDNVVQPAENNWRECTANATTPEERAACHQTYHQERW